MTPRPKVAPPEAPVYDFRQPQKFSREHVRVLQLVGETFSRRLSTALSTTVRAVSQVSVVRVAQVTYQEFLDGLAKPAHLVLLALNPLAGTSLLHFPVPVIMTAIDRLLGGPGSPNPPVRPLSEIELALSRRVVERMLRELAYAFESITPIRPEIVHQESNPQFAQIASAGDLVLLMDFAMKIGGEGGTATLCIPFTSLQQFLDEPAVTMARLVPAAADPRGIETALANQVADALVEVSVSFNPTTLLSSEVRDLRPGDVVSLRHRAEDPLHVAVAGRDRFTARAGSRGRRLACLILDGPTKE